MEKTEQKRLEARANILKALAHPTRLFIVETLAEKEECVCRLQEMIGADMSTVSKHLSLLKQAGIVDHEKRGTQVYYSLKVPCILNSLACAESVLEANATTQKELVR